MTPQDADLASPPRRVLATRNTAWARALARSLGRIGVRPNAVSMAGGLFALAASAAFCLATESHRTGRTALLVVAAATIQLRLLCNLLDGMLAVEEGFESPTGVLYNEIPDRVSDVAILAGAGYAVQTVDYGSALGWAASVLAVLTAYVRVLGGSLGATQHFIGPMAKQHRMLTLTIATLVAAVEATLGLPPRALIIGLVLIVAGSLVTVVRRTMGVAAEMDGR